MKNIRLVIYQVRSYKWFSIQYTDYRKFKIVCVCKQEKDTFDYCIRKKTTGQKICEQ